MNPFCRWFFGKFRWYFVGFAPGFIGGLLSILTQSQSEARNITSYFYVAVSILLFYQKKIHEYLRHFP